MKTNKMISLDSEIMVRLREEENASALVERLLREYFSITGDKKKNLKIQKTMTLKNLSKQAKMMRLELRMLNKVEGFGMDSFAIRWLRGQEECPSSMQVINYKNGRDIRLPTDNFFKSWQIISEHGDIFEKV